MTKRRNLQRRLVRTSSRRLHHETLEKRELLAAEFGGVADGPRLISVAANSGEQFDLDGNNVLHVAPTELTLRFGGGRPIDASTLSAIQFRASGGDGTFEGNEPAIIPGFLGFASDQGGQVVVARFAETLADDQYRIEIAGFDDTNAAVVGLRDVDGVLLSPPNPSDPNRPTQFVEMNVEVGARVLAVVPQPIEGVGSGRTQLRNQIFVYFNDDPLSNPDGGRISSASNALPVVNPQFYKMIFTQDTVENTDDVQFLPSLVVYDPLLNRAELTFSSDLSELAPAAANNGGGTFRLRIGGGEAKPAPPVQVPVATDNNDTFALASPLGVSFGSGTQSVVVTGGVIQSSKDVIPPWPGAADAAGLRNNRRDAQVVGRFDTQTGIDIFRYNFADTYGLDPQLNRLDNEITEIQKQRAREVLGLYAKRLGVEFIETDDEGLQIVTGDLRALAVSADTGAGVPYSLYRVNDSDPTKGVLVLDAGENWFDGYGLSPNANQPSWFVEAVRGIGSLLGIGTTFELPPGNSSGGSTPDEPNSLGFSEAYPNVPLEPDFLDQSGVTIGQALHRPEGDDLDFYSFRATENGRLTAETFAQRLDGSSLLDTHLKLYRVVNAAAGEYELVAVNDDFYSDDSFIGVDLVLPTDTAGNPIPTDYIIGVSASGNENYNGDVTGSALGGVSEGRYELRIVFETQAGPTITDTNGTRLDGDGDGNAGGEFNFWFRVARDKANRAADEPRTIFVDKFSGNAANNGTLASPLKTISAAFAAARPGDVVRLLPNGGLDGLITTTADNQPYEIGRGGSGNRILPDGLDFEVPRGVTVMIDAGAILKLQGTKISVGSESVDEDRSLAALQVLGTPMPVSATTGQPLLQNAGSVFFTSFDDATLGVDNNTLNVPPQPGNWAGIEFRNDFDYSESRPVWESEGIFLDYASHANIRYGGGSTGPNEAPVAPFEMAESRPTLIYNTIRDNLLAAMVADPNSFLETNFHAPAFQRVAAFTSDYDRVGPQIVGNRLANNSINGLFIRVVTPAAGQLAPMTVSGRFDDQDIVHVLTQVLVLQGQPGGPLLLENRPDVLNVQIVDATGGTLTPGTVYDYRVTFVTEEGNESLASNRTAMRVVPAGGAFRLDNLPQAPAGFAGRRLYRLDPVTGDYVFVTQLDRVTRQYTDTGTTRGGTLPASSLGGSILLPRYDARLSVDPGLIVKLRNARIEAGFGSDFYAEGVDGQSVVFTSRRDDSYGAGGTFDTNNDRLSGNSSPGDWGGLVFRQDATASLDFVEIVNAGGNVASGNEFNPIEILQAEARVTNSVIRDNADGFASSGTRGGIGFNAPAAIFVRGSQPIIANNTIVDNAGAAISINPNAMDFHDVLDGGRSTGNANLIRTALDNQGPLIVGNRLSGNDINGLSVRSEVIDTESVWDDTDIVHVVQGEIHTLTHHHRGGLRLKSDADRSLVVKFGAAGSLIGGGRPLDISDRIGGTLQIIGKGGFPVILTSLADDSVGAGFTPAGIAQTDTDNATAQPSAGDWIGLQLQTYINDRNVAYVTESEQAIAAAIADNATANRAQVIGNLAAHEFAGDESERLGFNIRGTIADPGDHDVYRFTADGGTVLYVDIDDTTFGLDTVVELIDVNDNVLARSDNSFAETSNPTLLDPSNALGPGAVRPLFNIGKGNVESPNSLDAGMRVVLNGTGPDNVYYVRVRSANGKSTGQYMLSLRLRETDEVAGSTVQLADIRYATTAILVSGAPLHSPLAGESSEELDYLPNGTAVDTDGAADRLVFSEANAARLGNLLTTDRAALYVSGEIGNISPTLVGFDPGEDLDVYQVDLFAQQIEPDVFDSENRFVTATFDIDYADGIGRVNTSLAVFDSNGQLILHSRDSNIADDVGRPLRGADSANLEGGSAGVLDAHIGPVELPEGTYYVVVSSALVVPDAMDQFFNPNSNNPNVRLMPINSMRRIADDSLDSVTGLQYSADRPIVAPLFDASSIVDYTLDDMRLFVSYDGGISGNNNSILTSFNPFTGVMERLIGQSPQPTGDIAIRRDGELFSFSLGPPSGPVNGGNTGNFLNISPVDGSANNVGDDGITFMRNNQNGNDLENDPNAELDIYAMAFPRSGSSSINTSVVGDNERFFAIGERDNTGRGGEIPDTQRRNILYSYVASNGEVTSRGSTDATFHRNFDGQIPYLDFYETTSPDFEFGVVDTGAIFPTGGDGGRITGLDIDPADSDRLLAVTDLGGLHSFDPSITIDAPTSGGSFFFGADNVIPTTFHGRVAPHPEHTSASIDPATNEPFLQFQSLTYGPNSVEGGIYQDVLFAVTSDAWLYAFKLDGNNIRPAHVLYNGRSAVPLVFEGNVAANGRVPNGIAFSNLQNNPWHFTDDRGGDAGHGILTPEDRSRIPEPGENSLYFGFEITGNAADNTISRPDNDPLGEISPGGVQGSVISKPFNLEDYSPDDKPTLYFSYFMEVEADDDYVPAVRQQNDSFRVFGAGDDGRWLLLGTNNNFRELARSDEYDLYDDSEIPVQELFDDNAGWRQARVDISPLAGNENVRIRFDFSTSGSSRATFGSIELVAVPGDDVTDRELLQFRNEKNQLIQLQSLVGLDVVIPSGSVLSDGDRFSVRGPEGLATIRFVIGPAGPGEVQFNASQSATTIANNVVLALPKSLRPVADGGGRISMLAAFDVQTFGNSPIAQSSPTRVIENGLDQLVVPAGIDIAAGEELVVTGGGTSTRFKFVTAASGDPDDFIFSSSESALAIATRIINRLPVVLDAVLETSGRITFVNSPVTFATTPTLPANEFATKDIEQNRLQITVPSGAGIRNGSSLVIEHASGDSSVSTSIRFLQGADNSSPGIVNYDPATPADEIARRLQTAILGLGGLDAELDPLLGPDSFDIFSNTDPDDNSVVINGNSIYVIADNATNVAGTFGSSNISDAPVGAEDIVLPAGSGLRNGERVFIDDGRGGTFIQFLLDITSGATPAGPNNPGNPTANPPVPPSPGTPGEVHYTATDTVETIVANFIIAMGANHTADNNPAPNTVRVIGAEAIVEQDPLSNIRSTAPNGGPTLGQFINLPPQGNGLTNNETIRIFSPDAPNGSIVIRFVDADAPPNPLTDVNYDGNDSGNAIEQRLQAILPSYLRAIVTPNGAAGQVVQILNATDITTGGTSQIVTGPNTYSRNVIELDIKDGNELRNGEELRVTLDTVTTRLVFIRQGSGLNVPGAQPVFYSLSDTAADLYDRILEALPQDNQAYIDLDGDGVIVGAPGASVVAVAGVAGFTGSQTDIDTLAIPVTLPPGADLRNGERLTIVSKDDLTGSSPIVITFVQGTGTAAPNEVRYQPSDTASQIALKLLAALPRSLQAYNLAPTQPRVLFLLNASSATPEAGSAIAGFGGAAGAVPVLLNSTMTSDEVARQLQLSLAEALGRATATDGVNTATPRQFELSGGDRLRIYNVTPVSTGSYGLSSYSNRSFGSGQGLTIDGTSSLPADAFGETRPTAFATNQIKTQGAANNDVEGVYIDDIIVGFAERGEMVLNAPNNRFNFVLNPETTPDSRPEAVQPERQNETLTGGYALEIRTSDQYGVPQDYDPINLNLLELFGWGRSFDTNDRLSDKAVSIIAQPGITLIDGDTFVLSDGQRELTFEFESSLLNNGVTEGNVPVRFNPIDNKGFEVAEAIRNAINSPQVQDVLAITAATTDSREVGTGLSRTRIVELFGPAVRINPGGGRFIRMDLVEEETFQGRETSKLIPVVDHVNQTVTYQQLGNELARATVTGFVNGSTDTFVGVGKIGDPVLTGESVDDAPVVLATFPSTDFDTVRIYLEAGKPVDIDVDALGFAKGAEILDLPVIGVFDSTGFLATNALNTQIARTSLLTPSSAPGEFEAGAFLTFQAPVSGYYDVVVSSPAFYGVGLGDFGEYSLTIRPRASSSAAIPDRDVVGVDYQFGSGDINRFRDQGQIIIASNFIRDSSNVGVLATTDVRGAAFASNGNAITRDDIPRPGSAALRRTQNNDALIPGTVISNNVIFNSGNGGIVFSGGTANDDQAPAPVPLGRIVNNTVVGTGTGSGIAVVSSASPTLLNNVVSGFATGLDVDGSSLAAGTTVSSNAFHNNNVNSTIPLSNSSVIVSGQLFQDPARGIFIPAQGSVIIDSSIAELSDRELFFITVKEPAGLSRSPIIAPQFDAYGQQRLFDTGTQSSGGSGSNVFIDRGGIDRADETRPVAVLSTPQDAIGSVVVGGDRDSGESFVRLDSGTVRFFEIQLLDPAGTGPDPDTITEESVLLTENGRRLIADVDFTFGYSNDSRTIRLTPLAGLWLPDAVYEITLNNQQRISYTAPRGDQVSDGDQVIVTDVDGNQKTFEFESGFSFSVPQTTLLTIDRTNAGFQDRDLFTITSPSGNSLTFEINRSGSTAAGTIPIELASAGTVQQVQQKFLEAFAGNVPGSSPTVSIAEFLDIAPVAVGTSQIQLGTLAGHVGPSPVAGLSVSGAAGGVTDGETFTYSNGATSVTFEFDSDSSLTNSNNVAVAFTRQSTPGEIAAAIVSAAQNQGLGLSAATAISNGTVVLGGKVTDTLNLTASSLNLLGTPGVAGSLTLTVPNAADGSTLDGTTFSIDVDGTAITFRYTTDPLLTSPDRLILVTAGDGPNSIASKTADAIAAAFPDELSPSVSGPVITLGETTAIPPAGEPSSLAVVNADTSGLIVDGVSGGAIPVGFLPTTPASSIAATLQGAIADTPLTVRTFSPGGGTVLISNAQSLTGVSGGIAAPVGIVVPAVADLAGNPVRETRINNETRFTIIMPDVLFDLGDAPVSYGTRFDVDGARHTIGGNRLPRLGSLIDTEINGQPIDGDDQPLAIAATQSDSFYTISNPQTNQILISLDSANLPAGGETLTLNIDGVVTVFELVDVTSNPTVGNVPVTFSDTSTANSIATRLFNTLRGNIEQAGDGLLIEMSSNNSITITAIDDEDGVSIGTFSNGNQDFIVFTTPGTDPNNVAADQVLGFLNPLDPAGTTLPVTIAGAGLLQAWIDFDANGVFDDDEQVLTNQPVNGDPVTGTVTFFNIVTPADAVVGQTWMRVRLSESGNLSPTGVAVGGEVEDYQVEVIPILVPTPQDDSYSVDEDVTLDTAAQNDATLGDNDTVPPNSFFPVQFVVDEGPSNGTLVSLDPDTGDFVYVPNTDFNGIDTFTYRLGTQQAAVATVTITVNPINDAPQFDIDAPLVNGVPTINILERDDSQGTLINDFAINIQPGPSTAVDELADQNVVFTFVANGSTIPTGLFTSPPQISSTGALTLFPAPDAIGTATIVFQGEDADASDPNFVARQVLRTFVVNVQPVNDPPRFDASVAGTSDSAGPDDAYSVASVDNNNDGIIDDATITYTLREDNAQPVGQPAQPFFIPLTTDPNASGFNRVGILDVFEVGAANEEGPFPGGSQVFVLQSFGSAPTTVDPNNPNDRRTDLGGTLRPVMANGVMVGLNYFPPTDFNRQIGVADSFSYNVIDDSTTGGETFDLETGGLVADRLMSSNRVRLVLNAVNDRPEFTAASLNISVQEDSSEIRFANYATGISAGPPNTAFDEVDVNSGQLVNFTVTPLDFASNQSSSFFSIFPTINPRTGLLNFRPAANVFGVFRFEVVLNDQNRDGSVSNDADRGEIASSIPVTLTIAVNPVNDPPSVDPSSPPLSFQILEDSTTEVLITGDSNNPGLLDVFLPGPTAGPGDESANVTPGGNQTVSLGTPIPTSTSNGGTLELINTGGAPRLRYTPRPHFVGTDTFIYTVVDDGTTVGIDGSVQNDPRIASNTVTFEVLPVNDAPVFSGAGSVNSAEDQGVVTITNWATNVQAGPAGAIDEINGRGGLPPQGLKFVFNQLSANTDLFLDPPTAVIDPLTGNANLTYRTRPDANGVATFEVTLEDLGPRDSSIGDQFTSSPPRNFSINVSAVNDAPTFAFANQLISRAEDSGPFNVQQVINISPGPLDEQSQTVSFEIEPLAPEFASLFSEQPTISSDGLLRFTPAPNKNTDNVNGPAVIRVLARDSAGGVSATMDFNIEIREVNDAPVAVSDSITSDEDTVLSISSAQLLQNDIDPDLQSNAGESLTIVMPAQSMSVSGATVRFNSATGQITYDPSDADAIQSLAPGQSLVDSFAYSLIDASGAKSNLVTVAINISGINDAPVVQLDTPQLNLDGPTVITPLANDTDIDGTIRPDSIQITLQPAFGSVAVLPDGRIVYTPFASFTEEDEFRYTVADNLGLRSGEATITIAANASPVAGNDAAGTFVDEAIFINVAANDSDSDGQVDLSSILIVRQPANGEAVAQADGTVQYIPALGFTGRDSFEYRIFDDLGRGSNVATVSTQVVASRLQNPNPNLVNDVNGDGFVTAIDALLIINRLARADGAISIPVLPTDRGPNFFDTNGNQQISAADALKVINDLSRINNRSFEQVAAAAVSDQVVQAEMPRGIAAAKLVDPAQPPASTDLTGPAKLVGADVTDNSDPVTADLLDLIAADRETDTQRESQVAAIDEALADLL